MKAYKNSIRSFLSVIPANAGIQVLFGKRKRKKGLDSRVRGNDREGQKKVMVFGVFDRLHPGHISFLEQAGQYGGKVIVAVARDAIVQELKNKLPHEDEETRCKAITRISGMSDVFLGDAVLGSYEILTIHQPDIICLGYDQTALARDLRERMDSGEMKHIDLVMLNAHKPDVFHTSLQ